jgi:hypothetical protein
MAILIEQTIVEQPQDAVEVPSINLDGLSLIGITLAIFVVAILARPLLGMVTFLIKYIILFAIIFGLVSYYGIV